MRMHLPSTLKRAKKLRKEMSLPEVLLWMQLKERPSGFKFRKQHPFGVYVADFYCHEARLIIEVDGEAHNRGDQPEFDSKRDTWFRSQGIDTMRISARDVLSNMEGVILHILSAINTAKPPPSAMRAATSPDGGGFVLEQ